MFIPTTGLHDFVLFLYCSFLKIQYSESKCQTKRFSEFYIVIFSILYIDFENVIFRTLEKWRFATEWAL
jgi:hypothetical protein